MLASSMFSLWNAVGFLKARLYFFEEFAEGYVNIRDFLRQECSSLPLIGVSVMLIDD